MLRARLCAAPLRHHPGSPHLFLAAAEGQYSFANPCTASCLGSTGITSSCSPQLGKAAEIAGAAKTTGAVYWVLATGVGTTSRNCTGDTSWCQPVTWSDSWQAKGANSSKHIGSAEKVIYIARSPSYVLCGCLYTALMGQPQYPYWTLRTAWAQRVLTCHLLSAAGNDCTLLGTSKSSFLFDPGTAKAAKMLEAAQENMLDGAPTWGLLLSRGICDTWHNIMSKGQLYPFTVTNQQERRNTGRCKEHVEGHEKKSTALDSISTFFDLPPWRFLIISVMAFPAICRSFSPPVPHLVCEQY